MGDGFICRWEGPDVFVYSARSRVPATAAWRKVRRWSSTSRMAKGAQAENVRAIG